MAKPNNIYKNSARKLILKVEEIKNNYADALVRKSELLVTGDYYMVKITSFKIGAKSNKQTYHYAIRAYKKP